MSVIENRALYSILKDKAKRCQFAPGLPISLHALEQTHGSSTIPIREILSRLAQEGLVDYVCRKGFFGRRVDPDEIDHCCGLLRFLLRTYGPDAFRLAKKVGGDAGAKNRADGFDELESIICAIADRVPNRFARDTFCNLLDRTYCYRLMEADATDIYRDLEADVRTLRESLILGDETAGIEILEKYLGPAGRPNLAVCRLCSAMTAAA